MTPEEALVRLNAANDLYDKLYSSLPEGHPAYMYNYYWEAKVGHWMQAIIDPPHVLLLDNAELVAYAKEVLPPDHLAWEAVELADGDD